jgi:beta-glucosidase
MTSWRASSLTDNLATGSDAGPQPGGPNQFSDNGGNAGILAMGWGSGTANFTYLVSVRICALASVPSIHPLIPPHLPTQPLEAIQARARQDHTSVNWHLDDFDLARAGNVAIQGDVALVFINSDSGEGYITVDGNEGDRKNLTAWHGGDALVQAVAAQNPNTVVVVHSVGPLIVEPWIEHPNITAVSFVSLFRLMGPRNVRMTMMIATLRLGLVGWLVWHGDGQRARGRVVRRRESLWSASVHDREECERL